MRFNTTVHRLRLGAALLLACLLAVTPAASGEVGHAGRWLTDEHGRVMIPHGVAVMNFGAAHTPEALGFDDDDAAFLAEHGFDIVRVGMNWSSIEPQAGQIDGAYVASIQRTVRVLHAHGIYSMLDLHQDGYGPLVGTDGAPDWATLTDGAPNINAGFGPDYFVNPALERAFDNLWGNTAGPGGIGVADRFAAMAATLGSAFAGEPGMLGYDLFNEPFPGSQYATCMGPTGCPVFDGQLSAFYRRVTSALRQTDPRHLAFVEPNLFFDFGANTNLTDTGGDGLAFHAYCLGAGAGDALPPAPNNGPACGQEEAATLSNATAWAEQHQAAVINTEWAATDDLETTARVADELDAARVPWTFWAYNGTRFVTNSHQPPTGSNVNAEALAILDRPHPLAVAGVPERWSWDATAGTFTMSYTTTPAAPTAPPAADTDVWTSPLHFPAGYRVDVTGAEITSAANAATLVLHTLPGAPRVTVTVSPATS